jgi:hypothetical protein
MAGILTTIAGGFGMKGITKTFVTQSLLGNIGKGVALGNLISSAIQDILGKIFELSKESSKFNRYLERIWVEFARLFRPFFNFLAEGLLKPVLSLLKQTYDDLKPLYGLFVSWNLAPKIGGIMSAILGLPRSIGSFIRSLFDTGWKIGSDIRVALDSILNTIQTMVGWGIETVLNSVDATLKLLISAINMLLEFIGFAKQPARVVGEVFGFHSPSTAGTDDIIG